MQTKFSPRNWPPADGAVRVQRVRKWSIVTKWWNRHPWWRSHSSAKNITDWCERWDFFGHWKQQIRRSRFHNKRKWKQVFVIRCEGNDPTTTGRRLQTRATLNECFSVQGDYAEKWRYFSGTNELLNVVMASHFIFISSGAILIERLSHIHQKETRATLTLLAPGSQGQRWSLGCRRMLLSEPEMPFYWGPDALKVRKIKRVLISSIATCALYLKTRTLHCYLQNKRVCFVFMAYYKAKKKKKNLNWKKKKVCFGFWAYYKTKKKKKVLCGQHFVRPSVRL